MSEIPYHFAVILAGCGNKDGSEIHESVSTLLAIDRAGAKYTCFAPDILQHVVLNHITGEPMAEKRNVLIGALCIAPVFFAGLIPDVKITLGQDEAANGKAMQMGAVTVNTQHGEVVVDHEHKVVTTPCYMLNARISQILEGAEKLVAEILSLIKSA